MAANPSIDRHLYSAQLPTLETIAEYSEELTIITDNRQGGYFETSFSPGAGYYLLSYKGPEVPWQRLVEIADGGMF
jgi:dipeptidyl aminopeptidase